MDTIQEDDAASPVDVAQVRADVAKAIETDKLTRRQVASECDVAEGTFGPWLAGTYQGDNQRVAQAAAKWLHLRAERERQAMALPRAPGFQETRTAKRILDGLSRTHLIGDLAVIGMGPGTGKTASCRRYQAQNPNVFLATMRPSTKGVNTALVAVLAAMGQPGARGTPQALSDQIVARVQGASALIILDEAQHLSVQAVEELRAVHDMTGCGLAFVGDRRIFAVFQGNRAGEFAQLTSRIGLKLSLDRPHADDAIILAKAHGIEDRAVLETAGQIARQPGALRGLTKALLFGRQMAAARGETFGDQHLQQAWRSLAPQAGGAA